MARAYVLIETAVGKTGAVKASLQHKPAVKSVDTVTGPYDLIAEIEGPDISSIGRIVLDEIHTVEGVSRTITCLVVES